MNKNKKITWDEKGASYLSVCIYLSLTLTLFLSLSLRLSLSLLVSLSLSLSLCNPVTPWAMVIAWTYLLPGYNRNKHDLKEVVTDSKVIIKLTEINPNNNPNPDACHMKLTVSTRWDW